MYPFSSCDGQGRGNQFQTGEALLKKSDLHRDDALLFCDLTIWILCCSAECLVR